MKAAWELMEIFYVDKQSQAWLPERLVDWLAVIISFYLFFRRFCRWLNFILTLLTFAYFKFMVTFYDRIMIASLLVHKKQFMASLWIFRMILSTYRFGHRCMSLMMMSTDENDGDQYLLSGF